MFEELVGRRVKINYVQGGTPRFLTDVEVAEVDTNFIKVIGSMGYTFIINKKDITSCIELREDRE